MLIVLNHNASADSRFAMHTPNKPLCFVWFSIVTIPCGPFRLIAAAA